MAFRLIRNRIQHTAVIGFLATLAVCMVLALIHIPLDVTMPFLMVWIMVWLFGSGTNKKTGDNAGK